MYWDELNAGVSEIENSYYMNQLVGQLSSKCLLYARCYRLHTVWMVLKFIHKETETQTGYVTCPGS